MNGHKVLPQFLGVAHCTGTLMPGQDQNTVAFISFSQTSRNLLLSPSNLSTAERLDPKYGPLDT